MNLEQLQKSALYKADEEVGDELIDKVALDGINHGYKLVATHLDKQIKFITEPYSKSITLPADFNDIERIECGDVRLSPIDYIISGSELYITNKEFKDVTKSFDITYHYIPTDMVIPTDEPVVKLASQDYIVLYGAYTVLLYKKKYESAQMLFREFTSFVLGGEEDEF